MYFIVKFQSRSSIFSNKMPEIYTISGLTKTLKTTHLFINYQSIDKYLFLKEYLISYAFCSF